MTDPIRYYFYVGHDNGVKALLKQDDDAVDLSAVTRVDLRYMGTTYSSAKFPEAFDWATGNAGEMVLHLGKVPVIASAGRDKKAELILFDNQNTLGIVWGTMDITGLVVE